MNDPEGNLLNPTSNYNEDQSSSEKVRMRVVGELYIPTLRLRFCSQDVVSMREFVMKLNEYREYLPQ